MNNTSSSFQDDAIVSTYKMNIYKIVIKDILVRKKKFIYSVFGVAIGIMTFISILTVARAGEEKIYNQLEKYGANLSIVPAISQLDMKIGDISMGTVTVGDNYISQEKIPVIRDLTDSEIREELDIDDPGDIALIAPKLYVPITVNDVSVIAVGVDPVEEIGLRTWWRIAQGEYLSEPDDALIGSEVSRIIELSVGDSINLKEHSFTVSGILEETGGAEDYQIFTSLETLQRVFSLQGMVSSIDIRALCNACPVEMIADTINGNIAGVRAIAVKQVAAAESGVLERVNRLMMALGGITLCLGGFGVANTMITAVNERKKDIGIMRAVGASRNQIIKLLSYEAILIGIIGGILGYVGGTLLSYFIGPFILGDVVMSYELQYIPIALLLSCFISIIAIIYPAYKATNIKVADSFRSL